MSVGYAVITLLEILAVVIISFGILNEDKLIAFEQKLVRVAYRKLYMYRRRKAIEHRRKQGKHLKSVPESKTARTQRRGRVA